MKWKNSTSKWIQHTGTKVYLTNWHRRIILDLTDLPNSWLSQSKGVHSGWILINSRKRMFLNQCGAREIIRSTHLDFEGEIAPLFSVLSLLIERLILISLKCEVTFFLLFGYERRCLTLMNVLAMPLQMKFTKM